MKKLVLTFTICLLFSSCATILKKKTYPLLISTNESNAKVKVYDSIYDLPAKVMVKRSKEDLDATLIFDETVLDYKVKHRLNKTFLWWNLIGMDFAPANYLIDLTNQKRFTYGNKIYLNSQDSIRIIGQKKKWFSKEYFDKQYPKRKGALNCVVSVPFVNAFYFNTKDYGKQSGIGFLGISTGLEYFYKNDKFLSLNIAAFTEVAPFYPYNGSADLFTCRSLSLTDNIKYKRYSFGYGLNYSITHYIYDVRDYDAPEYDWSYTHLYTIHQNSQNIGINTNVYYQISKFFFVGVLYRPSFYEFKPVSKFDYEHTFSFDFVLKVPVRKK